MRHTTFRFALDPTPAQEQLLALHAGASRFAYNQCLEFVTNALTARRVDPSVWVPWSGYDLINAFNSWKRSEDAGRLFVVAPGGTISKQATGLVWRHKISAQVFEEAAVDLGRGLSAYSRAQKGTHTGPKVGFPKRKRKGRCHDSFRLRNKRNPGGEFVVDRDRNAAANLAAWAEHARAPDRQAGGRVTNASGGEGAGRRHGDGGTGPDEGGTKASASAGVEDTREGWRPMYPTRGAGRA